MADYSIIDGKYFSVMMPVTVHALVTIQSKHISLRILMQRLYLPLLELRMRVV